MKNNIPCKDCITLAICMAQYRSTPERKYRAVHLLTIKCSILKDYLDNNRGKVNPIGSHSLPAIDFFEDKGN